MNFVIIGDLLINLENGGRLVRDVCRPSKTMNTILSITGWIIITTGLVIAILAATQQDWVPAAINSFWIVPGIFRIVRRRRKRRVK